MNRIALSERDRGRRKIDRAPEENMGRHFPGRRRFLIGAAAFGSLAAMRPSALLAGGDRFAVRIASNQGPENAALQQLMLDRGYFRALSLDAALVESRSISGPMEALLGGTADICMISGFVGILPAIEQGKELRLVGAAMLLPALAVYSRAGGIRRVSDLVGRTIGVGATNGLLHIVMIALLRKKGIDPAQVKFVNAGSNAEVFDAVAAGKVDAGLSGIAGMASPDKALVLEDGKLWQELPEYTYQPAYASVRAIKENPAGLARCLAAYTKLFRYLSGPDSKTAYLDAGRRATAETDPAQGEQVWNFIRQTQPYALDVGLSAQRVAYLQRLNVEVGLQSRILAFGQVADMSPARTARRFLT
jgi:NitT/TauT family transport system substrate-binding protein